MKKTIHLAFLSFILTAGLAQTATAELLTNGNFTALGHVGGNTFTYGQFGNNSGSATGSVLTVNGWDTAGYNFVYTPGVVDQGTTAAGANAGIAKEAPGQATVTVGGVKYGNEYMWGKEADNSGNGGANAFGTNPFAGNFIAADGAYETGAITQSITSGLKTGQAYTLTFYWAVAQQESYTVANPANDWKVTLGSQTFTTPAKDLPAKGFSGWMTYTNTFTYTGADSTTANPVLLSFLAQSGGGNPPFLLLGQVSLVPEPSSGTLLALVGAGATAGWCVRRRRRLTVDAAA